MSRPYDVLVIGGGVSGLSAAIAAAEKGAEVVVLEETGTAGRKLILADREGCNLTNEDLGAEHYYDADHAFVNTVLDQLSGEDLQQWMINAGVDLVSENGYIRPVCGQAADVVEVMRLVMNRYFVRIESFQKVMSVVENGDGLYEVRSLNRTYMAKKVVLATGSKAAAESGSAEEGYRLAEQLGLKIRKPLPALTSLRLDAPFASDWDGVRVNGSITLFVDGKETDSASGMLELTGSGVDGIPAMQVSRWAARALDEGKEVKAVISFLPEQTADEAYAFLQKRIGRVGDYLARALLMGFVPKRLARMLIREAGIRHSRPIRYLKEADLRKLAELMTGLEAGVTGTGNFRQAQVCSGGVLTSEIDPDTFESRSHPGLYLAGELLDVDGMYGGYNLQWAFSSGFLAGVSAAESGAEH